MTSNAIPDWLRRAVASAGIAGAWVAPAEVRTVPAAAGAYALAVRVDRAAALDLPGRPRQQLLPGWHIYLGSARGPGGLRARLSRHFRREKAIRWHIDRLTAAPAGIAALALPGADECALVARLLASGRFPVAAAGFGSTDCRRCPSHLLRADRPQDACSRQSRTNSETSAQREKGPFDSDMGPCASLRRGLSH
jgi:Uri superfamily endonuclease